MELSVDQNAVVEDYGFNHSENEGVHEIVDPIITRSDPNKGRYFGSDINEVLRQAVEGRQVHDATVTNPSDTVTVTDTSEAVSDSPEAAPEAPKNGGKAKGKGRVLPANGSAPKPAQKPSPAKGKAAPKGKATPPTPAPTAKSDREVTDVDLDNTGKRERAPRVVSEPRGDRRYLRAASIIVKNLTIDKTQLAAKDSGSSRRMSVATANHCLDAWGDITAVLLKAGAFTEAWKDKLEKAAIARAKRRSRN